MSLSGAVKNVGANLALRQAESAYKLSRQSAASEKTKLGFSNNPTWVKTFNASVTTENQGGKDVFRLYFRYQKRKGAKSERKRLTKRYDTVQAAEAAMFDERMKMESKQTREAIMQVLEGTAELDQMPKKRAADDDHSAGGSGKKKKTTMRYDHAARSGTAPNRNPSGPGDIEAEILASALSGADDLADVDAILHKRYRYWLMKDSRDADRKVLREAYASSEWWKLMPHGEDIEVQADATDTDKKKLLIQAKCVLKALDLYDAEHNEKGNKSYTWRQACSDAVESLMERFNGQTVERWYIQFRTNQLQARRFPLSQTGKQSNGTLCPFTLPSKRGNGGDVDAAADDEELVGHDYRHEVIQFRDWFDKNQAIMSVEKARLYFEKVVEEIMKVDSSFMATWRIKSISPLSPHVAKCWLRKMGVEYCHQAKNYYVARHESQKAKDQRKEYIPWSFEMEKREMCWIQLTEDGIIEIASKVDLSGGDDDGTATAVAAAAGGGSSRPSAVITRDDIVAHLKDSAVRTGRINGRNVWEYHRDDYAEFHDIANLEPFGGRKSIAFPEGEKVAMVSGHDESMFSQNNQTFSGYVRDDQTLLRSKGNGLAEMVSACTNTECGWGMRDYLSSLTPDQLEEARVRCNALHRRGKQYHPLIQERSADILKLRPTGNDKKEFSKEEFTVTSNPAIQYLKAGNGPGREGNWTLAHFLLQFEDYRDFMFALFPDPTNETECEYSLYLEVDQSTSHCTALPNALSTSNMNHSWEARGAKKMTIRDSMMPAPIPPGTKYIGEFVPVVDGPDGTKTEHPRRVRPGDNVVYKFMPGDPPPYHPGRAIPPEQDQPIPGKFQKDKPYTKDQLWNKILENNPLQKMPGNTVKEAKLSDLQNIALRSGIPIKRDEPKMTKGYIGDGEVPLGMLEYLYRRCFIDPAATKAPSKDECIKILESLTDFKAELTLMQTVGRDIGLEVVMTPICHCEIAGRGVEYGWGVSKLDFRKINDGQAKKTREYIEKSFEGLTIEVVRKLARKAREYKLAYRTLIQEQEVGGDGTKTLALKRIEGVKESIKSKRQLDQYKGMRKVLKKARQV